MREFQWCSWRLVPPLSVSRAASYSRSRSFVLSSSTGQFKAPNPGNIIQANQRFRTGNPRRILVTQRFTNRPPTPAPNEWHAALAKLQRPRCHPAIAVRIRCFYRKLLNRWGRERLEGLEVQIGYTGGRHFIIAHASQRVTLASKSGQTNLRVSKQTRTQELRRLGTGFEVFNLNYDSEEPTWASGDSEPIKPFVARITLPCIGALAFGV